MNIIELQLFSEGGEGGSAGAEGSAASNASGGGGIPPVASDIPPLGKGGDESNISGTGDIKGDSGNDGVKDYQSFKEKYKDEFQKDFNNTFAKRYKGMKENEEKLKSYEDALAPLLKQYEAEDVQELVDKIRTDPANFRDRAYENGTTPEEEAAKEIIRLNKERKQAARDAEAKNKAEKERIEAVRKHVEALQEESVKVKELYPDFDFKAEMQNPSFERLLRSGISMLDAYRSLHINDIVAAEVATAAKATNAAIEANMGRPSEVGADGTKTVKSERDVESLTDEEIDDIMKRVMRGERISFTP